MVQILKQRSETNNMTVCYSVAVPKTVTREAITTQRYANDKEIVF